MPTILRGQQLTEQPFVATWKNGQGGQTTRTFTGPRDLIISKKNELLAYGYETEVTEGAVYKLIATINIDLMDNKGDTVEPEPLPNWELEPHTMEQSIYECQRPFVTGLSTEIKASIEAKLKNPQNKSMFVVPMNVTSAATIDKALRIYVYKQCGIDGKQINPLSLKRSILVSSQYQLKWSIANVGNVLSTNRIISDYVPSIGITSIMPPSSYFEETINIDNETAGGVYYPHVVVPYYFGWLEQHPRYSTVGNNRIQISQEWVYNKWVVGPNGLYDVIT
jgi:hypothetical protein